jgi:hypothetical protein
MANIYVGDNGTVFQFTVKDNGALVDIRGATVEIALKTGTRRIEKDANLTDAENGICEIILTSDDLSTPGDYYFQATVKLQNGNTFSSDKPNHAVHFFALRYGQLIEHLKLLSH